MVIETGRQALQNAVKHDCSQISDIEGMFSGKKKDTINTDLHT